MSLVAPAADARTWSAPRGELTIWLAAPDVVVQRCSGHAPLAFSEAIADNLDALIARGVRPHIFDDWEPMTGYDSDARVHLTNWTNRQLSSIASIHILVRSKIVAMGVTVANLAVRGIVRSYTDRMRFAAALAEAVKTSRRPAMAGDR